MPPSARLFAFALFALSISVAPARAEEAHGLALFGALKYEPGFQAFDYVNAGAPKRGTLKLSAFESYDSLNPFILRGRPAVGLGLMYDTLLEASADEPFAEYGRLAESVAVAEDGRSVSFTLREEARWHDGAPVTAEDVLFTFETLKERGAPFYRFYYANVARAQQTGPREVTFRFSGPVNRELPLILGQLAILPKHYWEGRAFEETTLTPPLGSGPYRIAHVDPGRAISYERVEDYWGRDLGVMRGRYNFDRIEYEYYRDLTVAREAFKSGDFDVFIESSAKDWATAYDFPAAARGDVARVVIRTETPQPMQAFAFNLRREKFQDMRVREALALAYDFEWANRNLFYGQYSRTRSYFQNSELAAEGLPSEAERALLEPLRALVPAEVFTEAYQPPKTGGSGNPRDNLRRARALLTEAGYEVRDGRLVDTRSGAPFEIEFLLVQPSFERIVLPFIRNLERLGIGARVRTVDTAQYQNRVDRFDFDIIVQSFQQSLSPGNEQRDFWGSEAAEREGSRNVIGIRNPAVDALIDRIIAAEDRASIVAAARALDRVLQWNHYVIPQWYMDGMRVAYWTKFGRPAENPPYDTGFPDLWWSEEESARRGPGD